MRRISLEQAVRVITQRLGLYIKDEGLVESALARPAAFVFGSPAYPTLALAAAAQTESLARNHALIDGNKRTAFTMLHVFLSLNEAQLDPDDDALFDFILAIAQGQLSLDESAAFIQHHLHPWT